jgi:hypothetical protein
MQWFAVLTAIALAFPLAGQEQSSADGLMAGGRVTRPPVLRSDEPSDNFVVTLPGAPAPKVAPAPVPATAPDDDDHRPLLRRAPKPVLPAEFERDPGAFTQKMIGVWSEPDAYNLYGDPLRERVVTDDSDVENGRIYAFSDPTARYREIELDFAKDTGLLRTVFVYPWKMTWAECRKLWGANVQSAQANKGRTFHSYVNRRLDVLVDSEGKVVSLGLY